MNKILVILVFAGLFSACGAQAEPVDTGAVQTAIAQTLMADWTATFTPKPTSTITPTWTPTATATETPTPTFTDTPTMTASPSPTPDLRVIDADPYDFRLTESDLPQEGDYLLGYYSLWWRGNRSWISGVTALNPNLAWTVEGIDPLVVDDMVNGWRIVFTRGTSQPISPQTVRDSILLFRSIEAAQRMALEFSPCTIPGTEYTLVETDMHIGDLTLFCTLVEMESTGYRGTYTIVFSYRNFYHAIEAYGWEREVPLEMLEGVARNLLAKLEAAPLSDAVTFQP